MRISRSVPAALALLPVLLLAITAWVAVPNAVGQAANHPHVTLGVHERAADCTGGATFCFEVTSGDLTDLRPGLLVGVILENTGDARHNVYAATTDTSDPAHRDTDRADAMAATRDAAPGEQVEIEFTIPKDAPGLYLWCDIAGHEQLGMWLSIPYPENQAPQEQETDPESGEVEDDDEEAGAPIPLAVTFIALVAAARRRSPA